MQRKPKSVIKDGQKKLLKKYRFYFLITWIKFNYTIRVSTVAKIKL